MFGKILLGSDGSEESLTAARMAARLAAKFRSAVTLVYSYPLEAVACPAFVAGVYELAVSPAAVDDFEAKARQAMKAGAGAILDAAGIAYEPLLLCGHPVEEITRIARERETNLIVVGSRGLSDAAEFFLGSVSEGVLHHAHCSVLIARDGGAADGDGLKHILLAADASDGARVAEAEALALTTHFQAALTVLTVIEKPGLLAGAAEAYAESDIQTYAEQAADTLDRDVQKAADTAGISVAMRRETGHAAQTILKIAKAEHFDLIAVGSRGLGTFKALLLGSVSSPVARHASCSVLVAR